MSNVLTLLNKTSYPAQFTVKKGDQVIVLGAAIEANETLAVPLTNVYEVIARTVIDGNTYTSAPISVSGATGFLARVMQDASQGTYVFDVEEVPSTLPAQLQFQSTWRDTVTFTILKDGKALQNVVCNNAFSMQTLDVNDTYSFQAVINGVTTDVQYSDNPNPVCTAINDTTLRDQGYYTLFIN